MGISFPRSPRLCFIQSRWRSMVKNKANRNRRDENDEWKLKRDSFSEKKRSFLWKIIDWIMRIHKGSCVLSSFSFQARSSTWSLALNNKCFHCGTFWNLEIMNASWNIRCNELGKSTLAQRWQIVSVSLPRCGSRHEHEIKFLKNILLQHNSFPASPSTRCHENVSRSRP